MLGIVDMEDMNPVEAQGLQGLLQRSTSPGGVETIGLGISIKLGRDHEAFGKTSALPDDISNSLLAAPKSVNARTIEEIDWPFKDRSHGLFGTVLVDPVPVGVRHIGQGSRPETDVRHEQVRPPQFDLLDLR